MSQGFGKLTECDFSSTFPGFQTSSAPANRKNKIRYNQNYGKTNRLLMHLFWKSFSNLLIYLLQRLDKQGVSFCTRTTYDDNAITNAIEIYDGIR